MALEAQENKISESDKQKELDKQEISTNIYNNFIKTYPHIDITKYEYYGSKSIIITCANRYTYKVKQQSENKFYIQNINREDIIKHG